MRRLLIDRFEQKLRGKRRQFRDAVAWAQGTDLVPVRVSDTYWKFVLPLPQAITDGPRARGRYRRNAFRLIIEAANRLATSSLREQHDFYHVAIMLEMPSLFHSQVDVFVDRDYFSRFFVENQLPDSQRPSQLFHVELPDYFDIERGMRVEVDADYAFDSWIITSSAW